MVEASVGIFVDYESVLARRVAESVWSGLSKAALGSGRARISTFWEGLDQRDVSALATALPGHNREHEIEIYAVGQDRPDAVDALEAVKVSWKRRRIYGLIIAIPDQPSPLAGSLLYQGVERLKRGGVKAGSVEPALLHAAPKECEYYARRLLERLGPS